jgi:hypothetical protein
MVETVNRLAAPGQFFATGKHKEKLQHLILNCSILRESNE